MRQFRLVRDEDVTGVSGVGVVANGVVFPDGVVAMRWVSEWPTSVVFHDRGVEAVEAVHGHGGATRIEWDNAGDRLIRLLFETTIDLNGNEHNSFADDLAFELRERWRASYLSPAETGTDIEDSLGISAFQVDTICNLVADILRDWAVENPR